MKKLFIFIAVAAALTINAFAGLQVLPFGTNTVAASSATNWTSIGTLSTVNTDNVTFQVSSTSTASDTSNKTWIFNGSVDNTIWVTNVMNITYASTGTGVASGITNLPIGGIYPFYQVFYVTNAAASAGITNLTAKIYVKPGI